MRVLQQWRQQLKNNNAGSSLVMVLTIIALVTVLATVILTMALWNYYAKLQNEQNKMNFYDAESALEEIRMGLMTEVSIAAQEAYVETLSTYSE